jgi:hypothetical protein
MLPPRVLGAVLAALLCFAAADARAEAPPMRVELNIFGQPVIYRYGIKQDYFFLTGTGLPRAFQGVPEAEFLARRYQLWSTAGNVTSLVGTAAFVGGIWYRLDHGYRRTQKPASWTLVLVGGTLSAAGTVVAAASTRLIYQAVNVFNERVQPEQLPEFKMFHTGTGATQYQLVWSYRP